MGQMTELKQLLDFVASDVASCVIGRVEAVDGARITLVVQGERVVARRAVSCLVAPLARDKVAALHDALGTYHITAVLERDEGVALELASDRAMAISSTKTIEIHAGERLSLRSTLVEAVGTRFAAVFKRISAISGETTVSTKLARLVADCVDVAAQRLGISAQDSHRQIAGTEQVRCKHLDIAAQEVAHLRAGSTLLKSRDLTKIDAAQVQIG